MRRVIVLNTKGGCGKTTIATNVASCFAQRGYRTALLDYDPQGSSVQWLRARPADAPVIRGFSLHEANRAPLSGAWQMRVPRDTQRVVVDMPAGVRAMDLVGRITSLDTVLIPIQPSAIDIRATADFIRDLLLIAKVRPQERRLALIGNRTRRYSKAFESLQRFVETLRIPVLEHLRESQNYLVAAEEGIGVCDLPETRAKAEKRCWQTIMQWVDDTSAHPPVAVQKKAVQVLPVHEPAGIPLFLSKDWKQPVSS